MSIGISSIALFMSLCMGIVVFGTAEFMEHFWEIVAVALSAVLFQFVAGQIKRYIDYDYT